MQRILFTFGIPQAPPAAVLPEVRQGLPEEIPLNFVSDKGNDLCVICHEDTGVPATLPIQVRNNYEEGVGQLCFSCGLAIHQEVCIPHVSPPEEIL